MSWKKRRRASGLQDKMTDGMENDEWACMANIGIGQMGCSARKEDVNLPTEMEWYKRGERVV